MSGYVLRCAECGSELVVDEPGWLEHHEDGSHTRFYLDGTASQGQENES